MGREEESQRDRKGDSRGDSRVDSEGDRQRERHRMEKVKRERDGEGNSGEDIRK
jgi:hypothetical protein